MRASIGRTLLLVLLLAPAAAQAQIWMGPAALEVRAEDGGKPAAGGEVRLEYLDMEPTDGPAPVPLDSRGRAVIGSLAEGHWRLEVSRQGAMTYRAEVLVRADGKPQVINAVQHNVPGAVSMMEVKLARARGGAAPPPRVAAAPPRTERARPDPAPIPPAPTPEPREEAPVPAPPQPAAPAPAPVEREAPAPVPQTVTPPRAPMPIEREAPAPAPAPATPPPAPRPETREEAPTPAPQPATPPPAPRPEPRPEPREEAPTPAPKPEMPPPAPVREREVPTPAPAPVTPPPAPAPRPEPRETPRPVQPPTPAPQRPAPAPAPQVAPPAPIPAPAPPAPATGRRSHQDRTCAECKPGESALSMEVVAPPAAGATGCGDGLREALLRRDVAGLPAGCQMLRVELPPNSRYIGYRYEVQDAAGGAAANCEAGKDCPLGDARWPMDPLMFRDGTGKTTVSTAFENRSADRERRAVLTVYYKEAGNPNAPRPMLQSRPRQSDRPPG